MSSIIAYFNFLMYLKYIAYLSFAFLHIELHMEFLRRNCFKIFILSKLFYKCLACENREIYNKRVEYVRKILKQTICSFPKIY